MAALGHHHSFVSGTVWVSEAGSRRGNTPFPRYRTYHTLFSVRDVIDLGVAYGQRHERSGMIGECLL